MKYVFAALLVLILNSDISAQNSPVTIKKTGSGTPVLLLPGFACPGEVWDEAVRQLKDFQTLQVTYAGFNGVPAIDTPWYPALRGALIEYIKKENLKELYVIGHSMGGNLAVELAAAFPDKITKLVLVDALPCMRELMMPGVTASQIGYNNPYNNQLLNMDQTASAQYAKNMADNMTMSASKSELIQKWMTNADRKTFVYGYTDLLKLDLRDQLDKIKIPVLILGASFPDRKVTEATFQQQYTRLPRKTILIANNSRHFIMFDDAEWMNKSISQYFAK